MMLRSLTIRDFVIVDQLELDFSDGFTVFTGETGAGKSILLDALTLALGGRADASVLREGAARAEISVEFTGLCADGSVQDKSGLLEMVQGWLTEHAFEQTDVSAPFSLLMRRVIDASGRSRAFINGASATVAQLRELGEQLVSIHGQHAHQSLLSAASQRALLDNHAGLQDMAKQVNTAWQAWRTVVRQLDTVQHDVQALNQQRDMLEWQVAELDKLAAEPGEWAQITNEHSRLSNAATLLEAAQSALLLISEDEQPVLSQLSSLQHRLERVVSYDQNLSVVLEALDPVVIGLQEVVSLLNDYTDRIDLDPARLDQLDRRMSALHGMARKYQIEPDDLASLAEEMHARLDALQQAADVNALHQREQALAVEYRKLAVRLTAKRQAAAKTLGEEVTAAMQSLSMSGGRLEIALLAGEPSAYGMEQIEFLVAGHAGVAPRPLAKVASGGELARISLAISVITSTADVTPTLIFDEVDSGIGGAVAQVVGELLARLGTRRQVLCVTHLPQVASQAQQHFEVSKHSQDGITRSSIALLNEKGRIEEIARMLGGLDITATTRKHAREMLA